jgi:GT2 family glycosyltransferase
MQGPTHKKRLYGSASYHHGEGLNLCISNIKTRFLLVLDPDFYIVMHNWIRKVVSYMQEENIAILGVPWHPYRYRKWRYFPAVHCTFFDLSKVSKDILDFRPDYETYPPVKKRFSAIRKRLKRFDPLKMHRRKYINCSADTGFRIYKRCYNDHSIKTECFTPVYKPPVSARLR